MTTQAPSSPPTARTPLHHWHAAHGARLAEVDGWQVPLTYTDAAAEVAAARTGLALADVSALTKVSLLGRGVPQYVATALAGRAADRPGGVERLQAGDTLACRLRHDHLLFLDGTSTGLLEKLSGLPDGVARHDVTCGLASFWLFGPRIEEMLPRLTALDVGPASLPVGGCAETGFASVHALLVRPPGPGVPSLRVCVPWDVGEYVWERLLEAGRGAATLLGLDGLRALLRGDGGTAD